jgi:hypothetical protein
MVIFGVLWSGHVAVASEKDRLLPTAATGDIEVSSKADGRALYVEISNHSEYTVTHFILTCSPIIYSPPPPPDPCDKLVNITIDRDGKIIDDPKCMNWERKPRYADRTSILDKKYTKKITPNSKIEIYEEMSANWSPKCSVSSLRGRKKSWYE